jgi:amidase
LNGIFLPVNCVRLSFLDLDMILMGVLAKGTPTWDEVRDQVAHDFAGFMHFTALFNATGSPTLRFPCGFTPDGRPVGFQLVGKHCDEARLLTAAHAFPTGT